MAQVGILTTAILPSHNALIPLFVLRAKFGRYFSFKKSLYWFLLATRDVRYSGSAITALDNDVREIVKSSSFDEAIKALLAQLRVSNTFTKEDFKRDANDKFLRLMIYLLAFRNKARDWLDQKVLDRSRCFSE